MRHKNFEGANDFQSSRFRETNAVKSTTTDVNAIDWHKPGHHLLVCAQLCIAADILTSSGRFIVQRRIRLKHDRVLESIHVSRIVTRDFFSRQFIAFLDEAQASTTPEESPMYWEE